MSSSTGEGGLRGWRNKANRHLWCIHVKDACRQTANCREVKLPALPAKIMGLGLCRAVPAVTPHLPCRAGRGSPLAGIAGGNVSPAAGRLCGGLPYWLTGIKAVIGGSTQPGL
jgi:hypothetical protein